MFKLGLIAILASNISMGLAGYFPSFFCRKQGIEGHIYYVSGNQMPSPDRKPSAPKGIQTTLYIYELTPLTRVTRQGVSPFYSSIQTKLVKTVNSDSSGYFKVNLSPGQYSLFTKKDNLFYANNFDGNNNIAPIEVQRKKMTSVDVRIDYNASY